MDERRQEFGIVAEVNSPIVRVHGLPSVTSGELVSFEEGTQGVVFSLGKNSIEVLLLEDDAVSIGAHVAPLGSFPSISPNDNFFGSTIDPLGGLILGKKGEEGQKGGHLLDVKPGGISGRSQIKTPFVTGISLIDLMLPLGLGQKELIIGDRKSGKTSLLLSIVKSQVRSGAKVIYAAVGKKRQEIAAIFEFLEREKLSENVIIIASTPDDSPGLIHLTPFSAMAIAEELRDRGESSLVILDDLTTHARYYREISLIAGRFPGRESYPGDMFHIHAKLLERAGNFSVEKNDVAITALPVAEIYEGDLTSHVPTNLMSITDGHIFLDSNIFNQGKRPAINIGLSVTRVGRQAHSKLVRSINRELSSFLALYVKMQELSQFGAELTDTVKNVLSMGDTLYRFFEQGRGASYRLEVQIILFALLWLKQFEDVSMAAIFQYRERLSGAIENGHQKAVIDELMNSEDLNELLGKVQSNLATIKELCL